jgi:hypothetical protein
MIEYRFRVPSAAVFTLYSYSKFLEYRLEYATAGSLRAIQYLAGKGVKFQPKNFTPYPIEYSETCMEY